MNVEEISLPPHADEVSSTVASPDDVEITTEVPHTPPHSPLRSPLRSPPRTPGGGLSELSKQLRVLQAKNQAQSVEIDRLERQLRILADLQGISVADLRKALQEACEAEAFGEMQHRVASLRAELEAASLAKAHVASAAQDAANAKKIANLELRVGEHEEVEEKQRREIKNLYSQLADQQANYARLEALCAQLRSENEQLKLNQPKEAPPAENIRGVAMPTEQHDALATRAREAETETGILRDKLKLWEQQHLAAEEQWSLRNAQYKARFIVQDENIADLQQQLSSLYVAFEMLREETDRDAQDRLALRTHLGLADAEVARQVDVLDHTGGGGRHRHHRGAHGVPTGVGERQPTPSSSTEKMQPPSPPLAAEPVLVGELLIKSSTANVLKKWKKREVVLYSALTHHLLNVEGDRGYALQFGVSTVAPYPKFKHGFVIRVEGGSGFVITAAATSDDDYRRWMAALAYATTGAEIEAAADRDGGAAPSAFNERPDLPATSVPSDTGVSEQEALDLELALEMSERDH